MGGSESQQRITELQRDYFEEQRNGPIYFGQHSLLINRNKKQVLIKKQFLFQSSSEYDQLINQFQKIQRKPFNVIYPKFVIKNDGLERCSTIHEIYVYLEYMNNNLTQIVKNEGLFSQSKTWFLLNQISKSLQILGESSRPHWSISPQTIYQNTTKNYFIYDSLFVVGFDPQNFLIKKWQNKEPISQKMNLMLQKGAHIGLNEGYEEDMYCLGLTILFALTGIHPSTLPKQSVQRQQFIRSALQERKHFFSHEIIEIIQMLTERETAKRMDNYQLRRLLKERQAQIIHNQFEDYQRSKRKLYEMSNRDVQKERTKKLQETNKYQIPNHLHNIKEQPLPQRHNQNQRKTYQQYQEQMSAKNSFMNHKNMPVNINQQFTPNHAYKVVNNVQGYHDSDKIKHSQFLQGQSTTFQTASPIQWNLPSDRTRPLPRIHSFDRLLLDRK